MKQYLFAILPLLAVVSLTAAQTVAPKAAAPADTAKTTSPAAKAKTAAPAAKAVAKPDSAQGKTAPAAQVKQTPLTLTPAPPSAGADTAQAQLPPLPPMRNEIATEKMVAGNPDGVTPRPKAAVSSPDVSGAAAPAAQAGDGLALTPAAASAAGKPDSTALAVIPPRKTDRPPASKAPAGQSAKRKSDLFREELTLLNTPSGNLRTVRVVIDDQFDLVGMVYGEELGFVRILAADNGGNFTETWKSPPLNSPVRGVFVENLDNIGEAEVVAYTAEGNIFIFGYDTHEQKYKTPDGTYQGINAMLVANVDADAQKELMFISKAGKMVQFDPVTKFEEWTSTETYTATDMALGNVDNDRELELVLNTGEVMSLRYKSVEWKMEGPLVSPTSRLSLMDVDSDGILELIIQYDQSYVRIIDVDQRREKW